MSYKNATNVLESKVHHLHADASYNPQQNKGFYSYVYILDTVQHIASSLITEKIKNSGHAEIMGVYYGLKQIVKMRKLKKQDTVILYCDNQAIGLIDKDITEIRCDYQLKLNKYVNSLREKYNCTISYKWVKGHSKSNSIHSSINKACDLLAGNCSTIYNKLKDHNKSSHVESKPKIIPLLSTNSSPIMSYSNFLEYIRSGKSSGLKKTELAFDLIAEDRCLCLNSSTKLVNLMTVKLNRMQKDENIFPQNYISLESLKHYLQELSSISAYHKLVLNYNNINRVTKKNKTKANNIKKQWLGIVIEILIARKVITVKNNEVRLVLKSK